MKQSRNSFSEAKASEILELAAKYYSTEQQSYTVAELVQAGTEAHIPDRLVIKAIQELKTQKQQQLKQDKQVQRYIRISLGLSLIMTSAIAFWSTITYNHLISLANKVETAEKQVENQLQRRANLIPQLVEITKLYANHESEIINQLIVARKNYLAADILEEKITEISTLNRAILNFSHYATTNQKLQSSQLFINLQYEVTGTANRLAVETMRYNQAIQNYNQEIQQFPQSLVAKTFRFERF